MLQRRVSDRASVGVEHFEPGQSLEVDEARARHLGRPEIEEANRRIVFHERQRSVGCLLVETDLLWFVFFQALLGLESLECGRAVRWRRRFSGQRARAADHQQAIGLVVRDRLVIDIGIIGENNILVAERLHEDKGATGLLGRAAVVQDGVARIDQRLPVGETRFLRSKALPAEIHLEREMRVLGDLDVAVGLLELAPLRHVHGDVQPGRGQVKLHELDVAAGVLDLAPERVPGLFLRSLLAWASGG